MRKVSLACFVLATVAFVLVTVPSASAQVFDHLKCYKMKDAHNFTAGADLTPFQNPPFPVEPGCKIKVKGKEFCIPVDKDLIPGASNAPSAPVVGQALQNDFICYKMKCPNTGVQIPPLVVSDQFGSRTLKKFVAKKLCTPAIKGLPPTTTTTSTTSTSTTSTTTTTLVSNPCSVDPATGMCDGVCPVQGEKCLVDPLTGMCDCQPLSAQCAYNSVTLACEGLCMNTHENCVADPPGTNNCTCLPLCADATLPTCAGTCPGTQTCIKDPTTTFCLCCGTGFTSCTTTADCCMPFTCVAGICQ